MPSADLFMTKHAPSLWQVLGTLKLPSNSSEKHVPDLLESIMRPKDPVKEELRQKLSKIDQFGSKITKMRVSKFWIPEIQNFPAGGQCQPSH